MEIVKAVVLAGDCGGEAPWPAVGRGARQLVPVANRPVLFHHLDALKAAGVRAAAMVTDAVTAESIGAAVGDGSEWGLELTHLQHDVTRNVLASAAVADFVGSRPVFVQHGDVMLRETLSALEDDFADRALDALILHPAPGGDDGRVRGPAGYIIGPDIQTPLRHEAAALDEVLQRLGAAGARIGVREVDACLPCRGGTDELLEANRRTLERLAPDRRGERVFDSEVQGPVAVHPAAEVRASVIRGPVVIGPRARITDAYVGPYTSIGAGAVIDCVEIEHSIVLDRAEIRFLSCRVEGSVIGPGAHVTRDFHLPRAVRLAIGEGAQVSLA